MDGLKLEDDSRLFMNEDLQIDRGKLGSFKNIALSREIDLTPFPKSNPAYGVSP